MDSTKHLLNDRYALIEQCGTGGFGAVYKAADSQFGERLVAVKEMEQKGLNPQELTEAVEGFKREALLLAHLRHPHLPRIYDHFTDAGRWYLVMDYIGGETLEEVLHKAPLDPRTGTKHLTIKETLAIGIQLCTVLDYLHTRQPPIIFRDLKPANVMLSTDNHLYLIDFGIARHFKPGQIKDTIPLGSPGYAAPEQYGKVQTTPRADIYSLGVMLHQLLTGNDPTYTPFRLEPLQLSGNAALSRLDALIKCMIDIDENNRPATTAAIKEELQHITTLATQRASKRVWSLPPEAPDDHAVPLTSDGTSQQMAQKILIEQPSNEKPASRGTSRRTLVIGLASLAGLTIVGGSVWSWRATRPATTNRPTKNSTPSRVNAPFIYRDHHAPIASAAWSPDGSRIVSASFDRTVQVWEAATGRVLLTYHGHTQNVYQAVWSPDGSKIASGQRDIIQEWQASNGNHIFAYNTGPTQPGHDIAWSPDGKSLAVAAFVETGQGVVQVWNTTTHQMVYSYNTPYPYAIAWSPDNKSIAIATSEGNIRLWVPTTGDTSQILTVHNAMVVDVAWSPDGKYIVSSSTDGVMHIWEVGTGKNIRTITLTKPKSDVEVPQSAVAWSPDSQHIASGDSNGAVQIWDANTGHRLFLFEGHTGAVTSIMWSPDGKSVLSGSDDHTVRIWQVSRAANG